MKTGSSLRRKIRVERAVLVNKLEGRYHPQGNSISQYFGSYSLQNCMYTVC